MGRHPTPDISLPYDQTLATRFRLLFADRGFEEKPMIGGELGSMVGGTLCCGARSDELVVRVGPENKRRMIGEGVRPHRVEGRETQAFVAVAPSLVAREEDLREWAQSGLAFIATL